jgi:hypothetical protein
VSDLQPPGARNGFLLVGDGWRAGRRKSEGRSRQGLVMNGYALALEQLSRLESFANVESNLADPPVSMPRDRIRAAGIDPELWYGLGIVGVWAVMDAVAERTHLPKAELRQRFGGKGNPDHDAVLDELDDLRNLFAHNFAGVTDDTYLVIHKNQRRRLRAGQPYSLTCGYRFEGVVGERIALKLTHFRHYITQARAILGSL